MNPADFVIDIENIRGTQSAEGAPPAEGDADGGDNNAAALARAGKQRKRMKRMQLKAKAAGRMRAKQPACWDPPGQSNE